MDLNPAGETPVMVEPDQGVTLIGSQPIVEYFDETVDRMPMTTAMPRCGPKFGG